MARQKVENKQESLSLPKPPTPDPTTFKPIESEVVYTPEGRLGEYVFLFNKNKNGRFSVDLYIPQKEGIEDIVRAISDVGKKSFPDHWQDLGTLKYSPIKEGANLKTPWPGFWLIQPAGQNRPGVFAKDPESQITDRSVVYGGCWAKLAISARSYCFTDKKSGEVTWGVTLVLHDLLKVRDDTLIGKKSFYQHKEQKVDDIPM